ncbi:MAG: hypothetical protein VCD00_01495 [Candidatus Hydrogenedentota bacterium]
MDMSKIVWLVVIVAIVGGGWLLTGSGMDKMYDRATSELPGNDPDQDIIDEATLSKYGGFNISMMRYEQAKKFYTASIDRYGKDGKNYWWNVYQLARVEEKLGNEPGAIPLLHHLWLEDGDQYDERVPGQDILHSRLVKLLELNEELMRDYSMRKPQ